VRCTVKLFAGLAGHLPGGARGGNRFELELPDGATVLEAIQHLRLPPEQCAIVLRNGAFVEPAERAWRILGADDLLAIWPPVGGG
jgi:sulfur carrier protein ThiS